MILTDTGAWLALFLPRDQHAGAAKAWFKQNSGAKLIATDYIVDELLTSLRARGEHERSEKLAAAILDNAWVPVERVSEEDFRAALDLFRRFNDKGWSLTDCTSNIVMRRLDITTAFAFDTHFRQFGTVRVVPD